MIRIGLICTIAAMGPAAAEVLATEPLRRGTVLTPAMVEGEGEDALIGRQLIRPVFAGKPVRLADTEPPDIVARQSPVTLLFRRSGLSLSVQGRAMADGGLGDTVTVLVDGRRKPLRGTVIGEGLVEVAG